MLALMPSTTAQLVASCRPVHRDACMDTNPQSRACLWPQNSLQLEAAKNCLGMLPNENPASCHKQHCRRQLAKSSSAELTKIEMMLIPP